jgi:two-component system, NarL family, nitrate/nitrite response regulator NarL
MTRVFIVSSVPAVRAGLRALLGATQDCQVVGESQRLDLAIPAAAESGAELLLIDAEPSTADDELRLLEQRAAGLAVVLLGPLAGAEQLPAMLAGRAWAYLSRQAGGEQLVAAVRAVAHGLTVVEPALGEQLFSRASLGEPELTLPLGEELTAREREVLALVARGLPNKSIAAELSISEHTAKFHVAAILAKLGAASRTEAVHLGARRGLVAL